MEIEDYDFFAIKRKERLDLIHARQHALELQARKEKREKAHVWRMTGVDALHALKVGLNGIKYVLEPHEYQRKNRMFFEHNVKEMKKRYKKMAVKAKKSLISSRILEECLPNRHKWFLNKSNLIEWKFCLMREVRAAYAHKYPISAEFYKTPNEVTVLRHLFRIYAYRIPISRDLTETLKEKRAHYRKVLAKLELIHDTMRSCESILTCTSRQHTNPNGCSHCGVIYMGGTLDGKMYVESLDRDTRLPTLVTLDFEMETLRKEDEVQTEIVDEVEEDLEAFEAVILDEVRLNIQFWWVIVLAWKRFQRRFSKMRLSAFRFNRRRLVEMKHEVDRWIKEPAPIDMDRFGNKYCDIIPALNEYVELQTRLKHERMVKWAKFLHSKLQGIVAEARHRRFLEQQRLAALPKPSRPIVLKTVQPKEKKVYVCYRLECKMRSFLTEDRYNIHMRMHYCYDVERYRKEAANAAAKKRREEREGKFMGRVEASRNRLQGGVHAANAGSSSSAGGGSGTSAEEENDEDLSDNDDGQQENEASQAGAMVPFHGTSPSGENEEEEGSVGSVGSAGSGGSKNSRATGSVHSTGSSSSNNNNNNRKHRERPPAYATSRGFAYRRTSVFNSHDREQEENDTSTTTSTTTGVYDDNDLEHYHEGKANGTLAAAAAAVPSSGSSSLPALPWTSSEADSRQHSGAAAAAAAAATSATTTTEGMGVSGTNTSSSSSSSSKRLLPPPISRKDSTHHHMLVLPRQRKDSSVAAADLLNKHLSEDETIKEQARRDVQKWSSMKHIQTLHSLFNSVMYSLEMVSKHGDVEVAQRIPLDRPLVRIGTHASCECVVRTAGQARREGKIAKIHCLLYCPMHQGSSSSSMSSSNTQPPSPSASQQQEAELVTLVDNSTVWGTYIVNIQGTRKVPVKITAGLPLTAGTLVCIGVLRDGPAQIPATEANGACVVYRVRCLEHEVL